MQVETIVVLLVVVVAAVVAMTAVVTIIVECEVEDILEVAVVDGELDTAKVVETGLGTSLKWPKGLIM